ncbi:hypothetical protein Tco_1054771 [Tanacetum coccineum]|uniref:Reverse transcriptase domain-containing protein n=1 Tax=Tanacetum coccineum TaxID=301880 RepID=A0ABQ5GYT6_9ASTR
MDREVKQLKQSRIPIVKVRWNSRRGLEYTWEREDFFKRNYPHLFSSNQKTRKRNRAPGQRSHKEGRIENFLFLALTKFDKFADKQSARPSGSLASNTQPNPKGSSSKPYQSPQARNEHVNAVFTQSGKSYYPSTNPNDQQNDSETPINFDSEDEEQESTPPLKSQTPKPVKETLIPKHYKPKITYPQRLRKEKIEAQYGKFLDMV